MNWQRRARFGVGIVVIVFAAVVVYALRGGRRGPAPAPPLERLDPTAVSESRGGVLTRTKGDKRDFDVEYEGSVTYASGATRFNKIKLTIPQRANRTFVVTAREAAVSDTQSKVDMNGDVRLTSSDGLTAATDAATYNQSEGLVRAPGAVRFTHDRMTGSGIGATYDQNRDVLWLLDQAHMKIAPDKRGMDSTEITAGAAGFARRDNYVRFERGVKMVRPPRILEADGATALLGPDGKHIDAVEMRGNARITGGPRTPGALQAMNARDINLYYAADGQALTRAILAGDASIQLAGAAGAAGRRIAADWLELGFAPDGSTLTGLNARDRVELSFPPEGDTPARRIRANAVEGIGEAGRGLTRARFLDDVEYKEARYATKTAAALDRTTRARTLDVLLQPGFSTIDRATFDGDVVFRDGDLTARAPHADYNVTGGTVLLTGDTLRPDALPSVTDSQMNVRATTIDLTLEGRRMVADGDVRTVFQPPPKNAPAAGSKTKLPGMLKQDQPVYVTAAHLEYDSAASHAVFTGDARLWQGQTAVQGQRLTLDDARGNLTATGNARSTLQLEEVDKKTGAKKIVNSIASADELVYEDALRRATYTTKAHVTGPQGDLTADQVEMYLKAGEQNTLERAEADGTVKLRDEDRIATGAHLTYFAPDEKYVMTGSPVHVVEQIATECRETTGKTLTFYKSVDTISVDGIEKRTEARTGNKCPEL